MAVHSTLGIFDLPEYHSVSLNMNRANQPMLALRPEVWWSASHLLRALMRQSLRVGICIGPYLHATSSLQLPDPRTVSANKCRN